MGIWGEVLRSVGGVGRIQLVSYGAGKAGRSKLMKPESVSTGLAGQGWAGHLPQLP